MVFRAFMFALIALSSAPAFAADADFHAVIGERRANEAPQPPGTPEGVNWWYYDVVLEERSGHSGVRVTAWQKCYQDPDKTVCRPRDTNILRLFETDYIPPGGQLRLAKRPAWVWAEHTGYTYTVTGTYWGVDDAGHEVEASYSFQVTSE